MFDELKAQYNIEVTLVSCGKMALYNSYLPGNKHAPRLQRNVEEVYSEIATDDPIPEGRGYL